jgi:hypothetical protein
MVLASSKTPLSLVVISIANATRARDSTTESRPSPFVASMRAMFGSMWQRHT